MVRQKLVRGWRAVEVTNRVADYAPTVPRNPHNAECNISGAEL